MPQLQVTTKSAEKVWSTPDGKMTIYKVIMDYQGKPVQAKTYSNAIATAGWSGTVESYEKTGRNGPETFVKQPQKEGFQPGGGTQYRAGGKPQADPFTMYLSYAKDIAIAMLGKDGGLDEGKYGEVLSAVVAGGTTLYEARPDAPKPPSVEPAKAELDKVFGETELVNEEETPWTPKETEEPPQLPLD